VNDRLRIVKPREPRLVSYFHYTNSQTPPNININTQTPPTMSSPTRYKFVFFTPPQNLEELKTAIFATGAGTYQNYSECMFMMPGIGQFRPGNEANPAVGTKGQLEEVSEVRCEMVCQSREITEKAVEALKR
jgi:hypothetical protein